MKLQTRHGVAYKWITDNKLGEIEEWVIDPASKSQNGKTNMIMEKQDGYCIFKQI